MLRHSKKQIVKRIASGALLVCILIIAAMQLSTNSIMQEIEAAFYCSDFYVEKDSFRPDLFPEKYAAPGVNYVFYEYDPGNPDLYAHFNIANQVTYLDQVNIDLKLNRVFAWHNFSRGTLWIRYSVSVTDQNGKIITGTYDSRVKISIQRTNGKWEVTEIDEPVKQKTIKF